MTVKLEVEGKGVFEIEKGTRLVNAIKANGVDILHRCGGNARCTTCRVDFVAGEPRSMTEAEKLKLAEKGLTGVRLACQIQCNQDMVVKAISTMTSSGLTDPGPATSDKIAPDPVWI